MTTVLTEVITDFHAIVTPVLIPVMAVVTVVFALFQALLILLPMSKTIKATLSNIFTVLCYMVIIVGIVSLIAVVAGTHPFVMISESMHPEVPKGSLVLCYPGYAPETELNAAVEKLGEVRVANAGALATARCRLENESEFMGLCEHKILAAQAAHREPVWKSSKRCI